MGVRQPLQVSIPYERGQGLQPLRKVGVLAVPAPFQSPTNGDRACNARTHPTSEHGKRFQSPTNGDRACNDAAICALEGREYGFNPLRTGTGPATVGWCTGTPQSCPRFNPLRTGTGPATHVQAAGADGQARVSIPYERGQGLQPWLGAHPHIVGVFQSPTNGDRACNSWRRWSRRPR